MQGAVHRQLLYFPKYKHFIRLALETEGSPDAVKSSVLGTRRNILISSTVQTSQDEGEIRAQRGAVYAWAEYPGAVAGDIHPWPTKRQRCSVAAARRRQQ
jgi:hypothetical protein